MELANLFEWAGVRWVMFLNSSNDYGMINLEVYKTIKSY
jgi:hypothetical protein